MERYLLGEAPRLNSFRWLRTTEKFVLNQLHPCHLSLNTVHMPKGRLVLNPSRFMQEPESFPCGKTSSPSLEFWHELRLHTKFSNILVCFLSTLLRSLGHPCACLGVYVTCVHGTCLSRSAKTLHLSLKELSRSDQFRQTNKSDMLAQASPGEPFWHSFLLFCRSLAVRST